MGSEGRRLREQHTLQDEVTFSGIGLHTGELVTLTFCPAAENTGIIFERTDQPGLPPVPCIVSNVCETARNTTIGVGNTRIHTVEHVLAAIRANEIDNLIVKIDSIEPPVGNGSSDVFVSMIEEVGIRKQTESIAVRHLTQPIYHSEGDVHLVALPCDHFKVSYTLSYPNSELLKAQFYSTDVTPAIFNTQLACCRSFGLYEEIEPLLNRGLIKGCSLANAVVVHGNVVFSKGGLFFPDEMVRHKVLDLIGDLSLVGFPFVAHIVAIRSGHTSHRAFAQKICNAFNVENPDGGHDS